MFVFLLLVIFGTIFQVDASPATMKVTNADIRDAILSLIHNARTTEDKLERHEFRDRAVGEQIKEMLVILDKRTKILDFVKATLIKFDERLGNIESQLSNNDIKNLPSTMERFKSDIIQEIKTNKIEIPKEQQSVSKDDINNVQKILSNKIDNLSSSVQKTQRDMFTLKTQHLDVQNFNKQVNERLDNITLHLNSNRNWEQYETKLEQYANCSKAASININQVLEKQRNDTEKLLAGIGAISGKVKSLPEKHDLQNSCASTVKSIESLRGTINGQGANSKKLFDDKTKAVLDRINKIPAPKPTISKADLNAAQKIVFNKIDTLSSAIRNIQNDVSKLKGEHGNAQQIHKQTNEQVAMAKRHFDDIQDVLVKYKTKLEEYNKTSDALQENILQALDKKCNANEALSELKANIRELPRKTDLEISQNHTLKSIEHLKTNIVKEISNSNTFFDDKSKYIVAKINKIEIPTPSISKEDIKALSDKIDPLETSIRHVQDELSKLKMENEQTQNISSQANAHMETVKLHLDNNEELLERYESKLAKYSENIEVLQQNDKADNGWRDNIIQIMEKQKIDVEEIMNQVRYVSEKVKKIPEKDDLVTAKDETLKSIDTLKVIANDYLNDSKTLHEENVKIILNETKLIKESLLLSLNLSKKDLGDVQNILSEELKTVNESICKLHDDILRIQGKQNDSDELDELARQNMEQIQVYLNDSQNLLEKYDEKLADYDNKIENLTVNNEAESSCCNNITEALEKQNDQIKEALDDIKIILNRTETLPKEVDMETLRNQTLNYLEHLQMNISENLQHSEETHDDKVKDLLENIGNLHKNTTDASQMITDRIDKLTMNLATSHQALSDQIDSLTNLEQVVLQAADGIMDTKRSVEYGIERVLLEVGDMVKGQSKKVNATINERFDKFQTSILNEVKDVSNNLTLKLGEDIDHVWHQIGTMHQQMKQNADALNRLQNETDTYVNGSLNTMDSLKNKFNKVSNKTSEIDESVNYLLGKLFLVSNEFNEIRTGLGDVLDEIKLSFREVQENIRNKTLGLYSGMLTEVAPDY